MRVTLAIVSVFIAFAWLIPAIAAHGEIDELIREGLAEQRAGRAYSVRYSRNGRAAMRQQISQIGTDPRRLEAFVTNANRLMHQFWRTLRGFYNTGQPLYARKAHAIIDQWYVRLPPVLQRSFLVLYYREAQLKTINHHFETVLITLNAREDDAVADITNALQHVRRIFEVRLGDRNPQNYAEYQRQLDVLVVTIFELLDQTHQNYWNTLDSLMVSTAERWNKLVHAAEAIAF